MKKNRTAITDKMREKARNLFSRENEREELKIKRGFVDAHADNEFEFFSDFLVDYYDINVSRS